MGIMTAIELRSTTWDFTCKTCAVIRNVLLGMWIAMIAFGESAGRARAAAELSRQGYHEQARNLMLDQGRIK
ncbi:MAG: hypothetical protein CMP53_07395 [Flavobacteriales bacterium]|nr:hypothetical protein [Flavobacteriales bacterium]